MHPTRRAVAGLCLAAAMVLITTVPSGAQTAVPSGAQTAATCAVSSTDQAVDAEEQTLLTLINDYRRANGKNRLVMVPSVTKAAAWFSRDMATRNYFPPNHVDSNGRTIDQRLAWCGVSFSNWAENIFADGPGARATTTAPVATTTTTTPTTTTTTAPAGTAPAPGTPEWWAQYYAGLYGR